MLPSLLSYVSIVPRQLCSERAGSKRRLALGDAVVASCVLCVEDSVLHH
jgi:hypothetical protein